ncbi:MAG: hypothetical protein KDC14_14325 [Planctomycetes bacterium]|nr:hypothetical protein [Planctomycetota bacterium]
MQRVSAARGLDWNNAKLRLAADAERRDAARMLTLAHLTVPDFAWGIALLVAGFLLGALFATSRVRSRD